MTSRFTEHFCLKRSVCIANSVGKILYCCWSLIIRFTHSKDVRFLTRWMMFTARITYKIYIRRYFCINIELWSFYYFYNFIFDFYFSIKEERIYWKRWQIYNIFAYIKYIFKNFVTFKCITLLQYVYIFLDRITYGIACHF